MLNSIYRRNSDKSRKIYDFFKGGNIWKFFYSNKASDLNRKDVYRLNFGIKRDTFIQSFGYIPSRPPKGGVVDMNLDFRKRNTLIPHPVYGWMSWVCILNPSPECFETTLKPLIIEAYCLAVQKAKKRK